MKYIKKEFNYFNEDQLALFIQTASSTLINFDHFLISEKNNPKLDELISGGDWAHLYEVPFHEFTMKSLQSFGLLDTFQSSLNKPDPEQYVFDEIDLDSELTEEEIEHYETSDYINFFSITVASINNIKYFQTKGIYLNQALENARQSDTALLDAIQFDKTIVDTVIAKKRIKHAGIYNDTEFLKNLSLVIGRQSTQKNIELNEARLALYLLDLCMGDQKIPQERMYRLFVDKLKVYSGDFEAFRGFLRYNKKPMGQ
jgi:hypothetical protein